MRNSFLLFSIFFVAFFSSCSSNQSGNIQVIDPMKFVEKKIMISDIAEEISYIPINNNILLNYVSALEICDNLLFAFVGKEGLLAFNKKGEFINRIGRTGNGPGEYRYGFMYTLDRTNKKIYIYNKTKILKYTFQGNFLGEIPVNCEEHNFREIVFSNNRLYLYEGINLGYAKYSWVEIDTLGNVLKSKYNQIEKFASKHYCLGNKQDSFNHIVYYWNQIGDTIFKIGDGNISPEYLFAKGDFRFPQTKKDNYTAYFYPIKIFFTKKYLFTFYDYNSEHCNGIYDKSADIFYTVNKSSDKVEWMEPGIINDFDGGLPLVPVSYYCNKNDEEFIAGIINPFQLIAYVASDKFKNTIPKFPEKKNDLIKLANSLKENDNPLLMLMKLKE